MTTITITITNEGIKSTKYFKSLSRIQQKITLNRTLRLAIQNGVNVVINRGNDDWYRETNSSYNSQQIVKELVEVQKEKRNCLLASIEAKNDRYEQKNIA